MSLVPFQSYRKCWKTGDFQAPWTESRQSIYACLREAKNQSGIAGNTVLPDDEAINQGRKIRFASGATDNILGGGTEDPQVVQQVAKVLQHPSRAHIAALYQSLLGGPVVGWIDDAAPKIVQATPDPACLAIFFDWLARNSPDREPAKFAIAMLGLITGSEHTDMFLTFGAHEEFTKFASVALLRSLPPDHARIALIDLARNLHGWGRIDLVRRLAPEADAEFRAWLVRDGFRNTVMDASLAYIAATDGQLLQQLSDEVVQDDDALMDGAADIFNALASGGSAKGMGHYADGATAVLRWLDLIERKPATLIRAYAAQSLQRFVDRRQNPGTWPSGTASDIADRASTYIQRPEIRDLVLECLTTGAKEGFREARSIAKQAGIDPWPYLYDLQSADGTAHHWNHMMRTDDLARIDQVIDLALRQLPLDEVATGPGEEMGLGPEFRHHQALEFITQGLQPFPGKGWTLIAAALQSPVVRNRNMAVKALDAWPKANWPPQAMPLVREAIRNEPRADVRARMEGLLAPEIHR